MGGSLSKVGRCPPLLSSPPNMEVVYEVFADEASADVGLSAEDEGGEPPRSLLT